METFITLVSEQGIWVSLSITLIFYILKNQEKRDIKQEKREESYQKILNELIEKLKDLETVKDNLKELTDYIKQIK